MFKRALTRTPAKRRLHTLVTSGRIALGARLRSVPNGRVAATGLCGIAVLGALAILVGIDSFHDICLVSSYAAWVVGHWA